MTTPDDDTTRRSTVELSLNRIAVVKAIRLAKPDGGTTTVAEAMSIEAARAWRKRPAEGPVPVLLGLRGHHRRVAGRSDETSTS